jgi:RND family efflux transporter MFP subunit
MKQQVIAALLLLGAGCARETVPPPSRALEGPTGAVIGVRDTSWPGVLEAAGVAEPVERATLSTRLMGSVEAVLVQEGAVVKAGQVMVRLDQRDVVAGAGQAQAQLAAAIAARDEAERTAVRMRSLYSDSAAPKAQLDAAEAMLDRAGAGVRAAEAGVQSASAAASYAVVRAPFAGTVTTRHVDAGAFAAPGAPLVTLENTARLRVQATIPATLVGRVRKGQVLEARIEGQAVPATVEGVSRAGGSVYVLNALVTNAGARFPSGSAATLLIPGEVRRALLVPAGAVVREGDLTAIWRMVRGSPSLTWVRVGDARDGMVEVLTGLAAGDSLMVPGTGGDR